jgi:hypothetical protein
MVPCESKRRCQGSDLVRNLKFLIPFCAWILHRFTENYIAYRTMERFKRVMYLNRQSIQFLATYDTVNLFSLKCEHYVTSFHEYGDICALSEKVPHDLTCPELRATRRVELEGGTYSPSAPDCSSAHVVYVNGNMKGQRYAETEEARHGKPGTSRDEACD